MDSSRSRLLLDYITSSDIYSFTYDDTRFFKINNKNIINKIFLLIFSIINKISSFLKFLISDIIFILPMGNIDSFRLKIANKMGKRIISEFYISKYDTHVYDKKRVKENTKKAFKLKRFDQNIVDYSTDLIFLNNSEKNYYLSVIDRLDTKTNTYTIPLATEFKQKAFLNYVNSEKEKLILCWWGSYIPLHGLDKIIQSAKYLKELNLNFKFYIFGRSDSRAVKHQKKIDDLFLNDVIEIDNTKSFSDKSLDKFLIENCDISFGIFGNSEKAKVVMPNKIVEALSLYIPVISQKTEALDEYFIDNKNIFFCESNPKSLANKIVEVSKDKIKLKNVSENGFKLYEERFSKEAYIKDLKKVLENKGRD
ncbi:glycosyltransferase [Malaciobacter molluscorum]|nr:glycosyltransferase [Malaciobacter molluscorum]